MLSTTVKVCLLGIKNMKVTSSPKYHIYFAFCDINFSLNLYRHSSHCLGLDIIMVIMATIIREMANVIKHL